VSSNNCKVEQKQLKWTTYSTINIWFESLIFFIDKGFARVRNENDNCEGELVYFEGQTDRIIHLDESEVSTDGTTKLSGG